MKLIWSEDFDTLDPSRWTAIDSDYAEYSANLNPANVAIDNGELVITARKEDRGTRHFTSGYIHTNGKFSWLYGRVEIRARMPKGKGIWPALWMMPDYPQKWIGENGPYGPWPVSGEIDIFEMRGTEPDKATLNIHYGNPHQSEPSIYVLPAGDFTDWHIFALEWETNEIRWYIDDLLVKTANQWFTSGGVSYPAPFDKPFCLILNVEIGGPWQGEPDDTTIFSQEMRVDWIRVYEFDNGAEMELLAQLQELKANIDTQLLALQKQSDDAAAQVRIAQTAKEQADSSITIYQQEKSLCQQMIDLLG
jgi:beta-glucanase (GH16 family)